MKVCFIYDSVFRIGGVQRVLAKVVNQLANHHEIYIVCNEKFDLGANVYNIDLNKVTIIHKDIIQYNPKKKLNLLRSRFFNNLVKIFRNNEKVIYVLSKFYFHPKVKKDLIDFIDINEFDIVIGCMMHFNLILGSIKDSLSKTRVFGWEHNSFNSYFDVNRDFYVKKYLCAHLLNRLDRLIVLTERDRTLYKDKLNVESIVIPNPLSFTSENKSSLDNKKILIAGRLEFNKGSDLLVDIIEHFCKQNNDWNFKVIGQGDMQSKFVEGIKNKKLMHRVYIEPFTKNIKEEYLDASIYISTSRYESFGLGVLEAMECGLPIITFNTTGPAELVGDNLAGFIIEQYDIKSFASKLNELCIDRDLREKKSIHSIARAKNYEESRVINLWLEKLTLA